MSVATTPKYRFRSAKKTGRDGEERAVSLSAAGVRSSIGSVSAERVSVRRFSGERDGVAVAETESTRAVVSGQWAAGACDEPRAQGQWAAGAWDPVFHM